MSFKLPDHHDLGTVADLAVLHQIPWLGEAAVRSHIRYHRGRYWIQVIYINPQKPLQIYQRSIQDYATLQRAKMAAQLFLRTIQRDPRGNPKIQEDDFHLCLN